MFTNGVVGFLDPLDVPGSGYIHDGLCCSGQDFSSGATGVRFNYTIMPWHTDLIDTGAGRFYTQGDSTYQKYMWENLAEYYNAATSNTFDLTIFPLGNIEINYEQLQINNHAVTVATVGDLSAGEYTQWFYNHPTQDGAVFWNSQEDDPVEISSGNSICSVVPDSHISCLYYPEAYALAVYNQNCAADALYDEGCPGWEELYYETYVEEEEPEVWETEEEEEELDTTYVLEEPEPYIELTFEPVEDYSVTIEVFETEVPEMEEFSEEVTQEEIMLELELEMEEPVEEETIEEPVEEEVEEEPEPEEEVEEETEEEVEEEVIEEEPEEESEEEESDEIMLAEAEPEEKVEEKKEESKKEKMKKIITNKLKSLAKEMGEAASLEEQQKLQSLILALLNFNAGFGSYSSSLVDGIFYEEKDIYSNKKIPENQKALRNGLANEILHNQLVELQWQK
jgi:hypothetical protein